MTDLETLYAAVLRDPWDDTPRLAFADWCDDHAGTVACGRCGGRGINTDPKNGYPWHAPDCQACRGSGWVSNGNAERAEFVRVQCELARCFPDLDAPCVCRAAEDKFHCPRCMAWDESESLREIQSRLWVANRAAWFPPALPFTPTLGHQWSDGATANVARGFPATARLSLAAFWGDPCPTCTGEGTVGVNYDPASDDYRSRRRCGACGGWGRTGLAARLGGVVGLTGMELVDREPSVIRLRELGERERFDYYLWADRGNGAADDLPAALVGRMASDAPHRHTVTGFPLYPTRETARAALSAAALEYARSLAESASK